ncbi:hypothetical protein SAMN05216201_10951 [Pseudomonas linyingensis]|uniref:Uncharacterized protein n=1 Tax=Pseudomonas linyingensis TaxID=915471 RepID=A0A1H6YXF4_9PSED|nr:hypothetical protein [Pseudomonas linyingensis]SEJ45929.1 hypothetical protein SAMN05216201_10951 [Pseudomonas linyingensis]
MIDPQPYDRINTIGSKEAERQRLASLFDRHLESGGEVRVVDGFKPEPLPPRTSRINPETVLKRRRPTPKAAPSSSPSSSALA